MLGSAFFLTLQYCCNFMEENSDFPKSPIVVSFTVEPCLNGTNQDAGND